MGVVLMASSASAQYGYGFGMGGAGSTVYGDGMRGEGIFLMGLGMYNLNTAQAYSIATDTDIRLNEYLYQSLQIDLHNKYLHRVAHQARTNAAYEARKKRIHDNPETADLFRGDALNSVLVDLANPAIHESSLRKSAVPLAGETVRKIPFHFPERGAMFSMDRLVGKRLWPLSVRGEEFAAERKQVERAIDNAINLDVQGKLKIDAVLVIEQAITDLENKVEQIIPQSRLEDYKQAKHYIKELKEVPRILRERDIERVITDLETYPTTSVGDLVRFMSTHKLQFGPAETPDERGLYNTLYENMSIQREELAGFLDKGAEIK
jgi:hypothetical protein